jgi:hypothetical protein
MHTQVASQFKGAKLELKELKAHSFQFGACISCPTLKSDLEACSIEIKELKHKTDLEYGLYDQEIWSFIQFLSQNGVFQ